MLIRCCQSSLPRRTMSTFKLARRPENWKVAAPDPLPNSLTFASQSTLPKLPVPALHDTLSRLKESLKPIAWSDAEYDAVEKKIDSFAANEGPVLQSRLLKRAEDTRHWLENWWDDGGYLGYRDSVRLCPPRPIISYLLWPQVVVNVSYYCTSPLSHPQLQQCLFMSSDGFDRPPAHLGQTPAARAAGIARAAMIFRQRLKQGLIEPESTKEGPICMDTYR